VNQHPWKNTQTCDCVCPCTPTPTPTPTRTPTPTPTPVELFDDFDDPDSGFPVSDKANYTFSYTTDETYRMVVWAEYYNALAWRTDFPSPLNFLVETEVFLCSGGADDGRVGIAFDIVKSIPAFTTVEIKPKEQKYRVRRYNGPAGWTTIRDWTRASVIRTGYNRNAVVVTRSGSQIKLYINDQQVGTIQIGSAQGLGDSLAATGNVGLFAGSEGSPPNVIRFEYIRLVIKDAGSSVATIYQGGTAADKAILRVPESVRPETIPPSPARAERSVPPP
jgi:hypothetical protein